MDLAIRKTARAVILTPSYEVLFIRTAFPWFAQNVWMLPGGGIEPHEEIWAALDRELFEETGASNLTVSGEIWREELVIKTKSILLKQRFFLVETEKFKPKPAGLTADELKWFVEYRWWKIDDLSKMEHPVEPKTVLQLLNNLVSNGLPSEPIEIVARD